MVKFVASLLTAAAGISKVMSMCPDMTASDAYASVGGENSAFHDFSDHDKIDGLLSGGGTTFIKVKEMMQLQTQRKRKNYNHAHLWMNGKIGLTFGEATGGADQISLLPFYDPTITHGNVFCKEIAKGQLERYRGPYWLPKMALVCSFIGMSDGSTCAGGVGNNYQVMLITRPNKGKSPKKRKKQARDTVFLVRYGSMNHAGTTDGKGPVTGALTDGDTDAFSVNSGNAAFNGFNGDGGDLNDIEGKTFFSDRIRSGDSYKERLVNSCGKTGPCDCLDIRNDPDITFNTPDGEDVEVAYHFGGLGCKGVGDRDQTQVICKVTAQSDACKAGGSILMTQTGVTQKGSSEPRLLDVQRFSCHHDPDTNTSRWVRKRSKREKKPRDTRFVNKYWGGMVCQCGFTCRHPSTFGTETFGKKTVNIDADRNLSWSCKRGDETEFTPDESAVPLGPGDKCKPTCEGENEDTPKNVKIQGEFECDNYLRPDGLERYKKGTVNKFIKFAGKKHFSTKPAFANMQAGRPANSGYKCIEP